MKIIIDLQGCQLDAHRLRGIGRYSLSLIKKLIRISLNNQFILFANGSLNNIIDCFDDELLEFDKRVSYVNWYGPSLNLKNVSNTKTRFNLAKKLRSYAISLINGDVLLLTSFFDGYDDESVIPLDYNFNLPPVASVIYDLIPLLHPKDYLDNNLGYKRFYLNTVKELHSLDLLFTISDFATKELINSTNIAPSMISNISSGCDKKIFNTDQNFHDNYLKRRKLGNYILYCGATDSRKNLKRLLQSYSLIKNDLKNKYKLMLVGHISASALQDIFSWQNQFDIRDDQMILMGFVPDLELASLYRNCSLFVFPSIHEGFGLPVLEAMSCGAPVIASNQTSIPQIIGDKAYTFDPYNVKEISLLIEKSLEDNIFLNQLKSNSKSRASLFSWDITAKCVLDELEKLSNRKNAHIINNEDWKLVVKYKKESYKSVLASLLSELKLRKEDPDFIKLAKLISTCIYLIHNEFDLELRSFEVNTKNHFNWLIEGPFDSNYSLSILNQELALSASQNDVLDIKINITEGQGDYPINYTFLKKKPELFNLYKLSLEAGREYFVNSRNLYPPRVNDMDSRFNYLHAYGWEETGFPFDWVQNFNRHLQGMTVMSNQVKKTLIDNGVSIPIYISLLGVDHINRIRQANDFYIEAKKYKFLHISSCFPRKGIKCLLEAYGSAFSDNDDVSLLIKTFPNPHNNLHKLLTDFQSSNSKYPHVVVIEEDLSLEQIKALYLQSDCLIAPSHGEGFGLPIAEAMSLGIPVITTAWGGQLDFVNSSNSWLIDYQFAYSETHFNIFSSVWAVPSVEDCSFQMKKIYNTSDFDINVKTALAKSTISSLTWENTVKDNIIFIKNFIQRKKIKNSHKVGWITTWNSRCGIASYSRYLIQNLITEVQIYAPIDENIIGIDEDVVTRCWDFDKPLDNLKEKIINDKITFLVIQFNYGFYDFSEFCEFLRFLNKKSISIIIFFHSTKDPKINPAKKFSILKNVLSFCDRLMVHTPRDLNRLKNLNLIDNACLFPHGIIDFDKNDIIEKNEFSRYSSVNLFPSSKSISISSYGFCLPNKGFPELIYAIKLLRNKNLDIFLTLRTASYSDEFLWFYNELILLIKNLDLENYITIDTNYHDDKATLRALSNSDLIVYPYQRSNESSSAAIRQGLASGAPVAVTPLSIFDDVKLVTYQLPGVSSEDIARGVLMWFTKGKSYQRKHINPALKDSWIKEHSYSSLGIRLQGIINSLS